MERLLKDYAGGKTAKRESSSFGRRGLAAKVEGRRRHFLDQSRPEPSRITRGEINVIALRIIIFSVLVGITVQLCIKYAPRVGSWLRNIWKRLGGKG